MQIEAIISSFLDEYPRFRAHKSLVAFSTCTVLFLVSTLLTTRVSFAAIARLICLNFLKLQHFSRQGGMYILQLLDWYAASITVILVCLCEVIIVGWIYGIDNFIRDIEFMIGNPVGLWWRISWKYISPAILTVN